MLFFSIIERSVLMALVFYYKDMLEKVTMQKTQQFSAFVYRGRLNIQFSRLVINSLLIFSTSEYNTVQIKLISRETNTFKNCNDYAFLRQCNTVNVNLCSLLRRGRFITPKVLIA